MGHTDKTIASWNRAENDLDRKHDVFMADYNQDIWLQQFQKQAEEYTSQLNQKSDADYIQWLRTQSPEALIKHAAAAGINPAAYFSELGGASSAPNSSVSVPSPKGGNSGSYGSGRSIVNPTPEIVQLSQAVQSLSSLGSQSVQAFDTASQINANIQAKLSESNLKDLQSQYQAMYNAVYNALGSKEKAAPFLRDFNQALLFQQQGKTEESKRALNDAMKYYFENAGEKAKNEASTVIPLANSVISLNDSVSSLNKEKENTEVSQQSVNFAQSSYFKSLKLTEDALRSNRVEALELSNDLSTISKFLAGNELKYSDSVLNKRIEMYAQQLEHAGIINLQEWQNLKKITTQADWAERQEFKDYICGFFNAANGAISNVVGAQGNMLNRLSAEERNKIHEQFIENMRSNGFSVGTPYAPPVYNVNTTWK